MTPNLSAFLALIRQCEVGTTGVNGYKILYGGSTFGSFTSHPNKAVTAGGYTSTAAGAYQILYRTWEDFLDANGPHDFSPDSQDLCARWLIDRRGATADVEAGRLRAAITKCGKEWASLPGSPYGQPVRTLEYCEQVFRDNGGVQTDGVRDVQTPTRPTKGIQQEPHVGALAGFLPLIFQLFSAKGTAAVERISGAPPDVASKAFDAFGQKIAELSGIPITDNASAARAVAVVASDPAKVAAVEDVAVHYSLVEVGGGIGGAREAYAAIAKDYDDDPAWRIAAKFLANPVHWVTGVFLYYVQQFVPPLAERVKAFDPAAVISLVMVIFGVIALVGAYWLGTTIARKEQ